MNQDLEQSHIVKVFRTPRPRQKPAQLLDPLDNKIRVRLKSLQSPNSVKNPPPAALMPNQFSGTGLSFGLSPGISSLSQIMKKSVVDSSRNELPKLESSDSLVSTPKVNPNKEKMFLLHPSSKFGDKSFRKKGSLIEFSESQDLKALTPRQVKASNKDEGTSQATFGSQTERSGLPQSIFAPQIDKVRPFKESEFKKKGVVKKYKVQDDFASIPIKITKNLNLQTPKHSSYIAMSAPNSTKASDTGKSSVAKDWSAIVTPQTRANGIKEESRVTNLENQEDRKKRIVDFMAKELEDRWGIKQESQETPTSHNNEGGTPQSGEIFSEEEDKKEFSNDLKSENNRNLRIDLLENDSESQVKKKIATHLDKEGVKSKTRRLGSRKSVVFKTKEEFRGLGDLSRFSSLPRKNDVFSGSCVDFFQFNERNRFYDEFSEGFKHEPAPTHHPVEDMERRNSAMMVAFNQNDKIIQPAFMQRVGSMCFTEFWTKKINLVFFKKIKKSPQYLRLNEPGRENETVYRPGKWKKEAFTKEKIIEHSSAWTTKSVALMKALEKQDGDSPTSTKAALNLFKKTQTPHVSEKPWVNTDLETFSLAQKLRNTGKLSLAIENRGVSLESARHSKQGETTKFRKEKLEHHTNEIEDIYLKNVRKARLAKTGHHPTEDKVNSNGSVPQSKSNTRQPLTAR